MTILPVHLRVTRSLPQCCRTLLAAGLLALPPALVADVTLPHVFGDHMVLQRQKTVPIWGTAAPGERVTVDFAGQKKDATADTEGHWRVTLDALPASHAAAEMTVSGRNTIKIADVLVGEVWLCSGQSNMEKPLGEQRGQQPTYDYEEETRAANYPEIRLLVVPRSRKAAPADDADVSWTPCSPESVVSTHFSAAAYFFGRKLFQELKVPIGLIDSSFGGSPIEPWIPKEGFALAPSLADLAAAAQAPLLPKAPQLAMMFNGMIAPLVPYALRGVLWYQGESNVTTEGEVSRYADKMFALIQSWRAQWKDDLPFYYVQIAPFTYFANGRPGPKVVDSGEREPLFWEQQTDLLQVPRTGMVVTTDVTDNVHDHHPRDKKSVGERLALWALAKDYGRTELVFSGPLYREMELSGNRALLSFDYVDGGLMSRDGKPLSWFAIAGKDGKFVPATATIEGGRIAVTSPEVAAPAAVRFAWDELAMPNLCNKAGLPADSFRTDPVRWRVPVR